MTQTEVFNIPLPAATDSYAPVGHKQVVKRIEKHVKGSGLKIVNKQFIAAQKGQVITGLIDLEAKNTEFGYRLGFQNSYNKERPLTFVSGTNVLICTNGMVLGEQIFVRKHTGSVLEEMNHRIEQVILGLDKELEKTLALSEKMKAIEVDPRAQAELVGRMFLEHEIINSTQVNILQREFKTPTYGDAFGEDTLWTFYNHITHALKNTHAYNYNQKHKEVQNWFEAEFELVEG